MPTLSTHVLDSAGGGPKVGVLVELHDAGGALVGSAATGSDGRAGRLGEELAPGAYRLSWRTGGAFVASVSAEIHLIEDRHYHVPLLASGASAVLYRGV